MITKNIGMILLALWLIATGMIAVFGLSFREMPLVMGLVAIAAGVLILIGR